MHRNNPILRIIENIMFRDGVELVKWQERRIWRSGMKY